MIYSAFLKQHSTQMSLTTSSYAWRIETANEEDSQTKTTTDTTATTTTTTTTTISAGGLMTVEETFDPSFSESGSSDKLLFLLRRYNLVNCMLIVSREEVGGLGCGGRGERLGVGRRWAGVVRAGKEVLELYGRLTNMGTDVGVDRDQKRQESSRSTRTTIVEALRRQTVMSGAAMTGLSCPESTHGGDKSENDDGLGDDFIVQGIEEEEALQEKKREEEKRRIEERKKDNPILRQKEMARNRKTLKMTVATGGGGVEFEQVEKEKKKEQSRKQYAKEIREKIKKTRAGGEKDQGTMKHSRSRKLMEKDAKEFLSSGVIVGPPPPPDPASPSQQENDSRAINNSLHEGDYSDDREDDDSTSSLPNDTTRLPSSSPPPRQQYFPLPPLPSLTKSQRSELLSLRIVPPSTLKVFQAYIASVRSQNAGDNSSSSRNSSDNSIRKGAGFSDLEGCKSFLLLRSNPKFRTHISRGVVKSLAKKLNEIDAIARGEGGGNNPPTGYNGENGDDQQLFDSEHNAENRAAIVRRKSNIAGVYLDWLHQLLAEADEWGS